MRRGSARRGSASNSFGPGCRRVGETYQRTIPRSDDNKDVMIRPLPYRKTRGMSGPISYLFWAIDVSGTARVSTGAQCRIPIIASHPEHPFPAPENLAAEGVSERKKGAFRDCPGVPNPAKRLKVVQRPETVCRLLIPRRN